MRCLYAAFWIALLWMLAGTSAGFAQDPERPTVRGLFGDRTLGRPIQPGPSNFGGGIQRGPSGNFLSQGRSDGSAMFSAPWRRVELAPLVFGAGLPAPVVEVNVPPPVVVQPPAEPQPVPVEQAPDAWFRGPPGEAAAAAPGSAMYVPRWSSGSSVAGSSAPAYRPGPVAPAPAISARVTRLSQSGGVQTSSGIAVSLQGGTAIVRGVVANPSQRALVGNLVRLEPGVWQVDNRLTVAGQALSGQP